MKPIRVAINGLGRIGRAFLKLAQARPELEIVAVNDLGDPANLAYLLRYDSAYGRSNLDIKIESGALVIGGRRVAFFQEPDPLKLPWAELAVGVVVEATGFFTTYEKARAHLTAGARKVVVSAPIKGEPTPGVVGATVLMGVNEEKLAVCQISSNASCTTNSVSPIIQIMLDSVGVEKAVLNTVHAYTASQRLVDSPDLKDYRRGRAGAMNIVPSTTGAASAVTKAIPTLTGRFDGIALRVPVLVGSLADLTFVAKRVTSVEEVNEILRQAARTARWEGLFTVTEEPLVSSDIVGNTHAAIADLAFTKVVGGDLVKILSWYDNELGYAQSLLRHVIKTAAS